jgi:hypothetical protein
MGPGSCGPGPGFGQPRPILRAGPKPQPKPASWSIYKIASKAIWLGGIQDAGHEADDDTEMARREGEITPSDLKRTWPHHVALPAESLTQLGGPDERLACH